MADIPEDVKAQAYQTATLTREHIAQVEQSGATPPYDKQGRLSPEIEERLNSPTVDSYEQYNQDKGIGQDVEAPDSGFEPGKG